MKIHQILAGFADGDAISQEAVQLRDIFRCWGYASDIFVDAHNVSPGFLNNCHALTDFDAGPDDLCFHHYGIASPATKLFLSSSARKILVYHNITPAKFFTGFDDGIAARLRQARESLPNIAGRVDAVWADSRFNADELKSAGVQGVKVFPLLFTANTLDQNPDPVIIKRFTGTLKNILFVGRIAPNKHIEDLILAFAWYQKSINPFSRLLIVGSNRSAPRYYTMLRMVAGDMDLPNVCFEGFASASGLAAYYEAADVYVCPSVHEGYCLPLIEAMYKDVPVIARNIGGMPETMDGAGVLYDELEPVELAELIHRVLSKQLLRKTIRHSQQERVKRLLQRPVDEELKALMVQFL